MMADEHIRREDLINHLAICKKGTDIPNLAWAAITAIECYVRDMPAADVAPVVRCKDCQNWKRNVGLTDSPNGHCFEHDIDTNGRDFCSYGERMRQAKMDGGNENDS